MNDQDSTMLIGIAEGAVPAVCRIIIWEHTPTSFGVDKRGGDKY